jgi:hypothetical protein
VVAEKTFGESTVKHSQSRGLQFSEALLKQEQTDTCSVRRISEFKLKAGASRCGGSGIVALATAIREFVFMTEA